MLKKVLFLSLEGFSSVFFLMRSLLMISISLPSIVKLLTKIHFYSSITTLQMFSALTYSIWIPTFQIHQDHRYIQMVLRSSSFLHLL